jgi:hypothetical protein
MARMIRKTGLVAAAVAALVAVMAPAAQAETGVLTASEYPAMLTAPKPGIGATFDIGALKTVQCGPSKLDGTITEATDPVTFTPTYLGTCLAEPGEMPVTVTTNGCDYRIGFTKPGTTGWEPTRGALQASLVCPAGAQMEIHIYESAAAHAENVSLCTYDIEAQGPVEAGSYHNLAGPPSVVDMTISAEFTAKRTVGPVFVCGGEGLLQHLPITLTGTYKLRANRDVGGLEGAQIPVDVG